MKLVGMMQQTKQQTRRESGGSHAAPKNKVIQKVEEMFAHALEDYSKFITSLHTKLGAALLGKKSSFCLEDMMKLMWLGTMPADTKAMLAWCREFKEEAVRNRVATPPILDAQEFEGLCAVFEHFDEDRNGEIQFDKLVTKGLIYVEQVDSYRQLWDANGDGILSLQEFCEMMCPVGYRATGKSEVGFMPDGRCVRHDPVIGHWKLAADAHHLDDRQFPVEIEPAELE
jgi:Ca2+-binding EF-hand superfamily protein